MPPIPPLRVTRAGLKTVVRFIVARSVSTTISLIVHQHAEPESKLDTVKVHVGAFVLGEVVADATKSFVDEQVDTIADLLGVPETPVIEPEKSES